MAGLILRTSRVSQELQSKDLIQKEIAMKRGVLQRRCDADCCQAGLHMLWRMQRKTAKTQEVVELFFLFFCLCGDALLVWYFKEKTFSGLQLGGPDGPVAELQLLGCKFQLQFSCSQARNWIQVWLMASINEIAEQAIAILNQIKYPTHLVCCHQQGSFFFFFFKEEHQKKMHDNPGCTREMCDR